MELTRRTYALPPDIVAQFEEYVPSERRSDVVATLIEAWITKLDDESEQREIEDWVRDMDEIHLELEREFRPLDDEVWNTIDDFELAEEGTSESRNAHPAR